MSARNDGSRTRNDVRLSERFSDQIPYAPADFAVWANDDAFAAALGRYIAPPHEFDRQAITDAITELVGDLNEETSVRELAELLADAIGEELRMAKTGDALIRLEGDRRHASAARH